MCGDTQEQAISLMREQRFGDALCLLRECLHLHPADWSLLYMAGQCSRFVGDIDRSVSYLTQAAAIEGNEPAVLLALGIALQLNSQHEIAIGALARAIEIDPDY